MQNQINKYPVQNSLLKNYIKFFWELSIEQVRLDHKLIPQRNINLRFNLSETPQFLCINGMDYLLEDVFFSGLQDHYINAHLKLIGKVHVLGVCFLPDGFYPFINIPVSEFKNGLFGTDEVGFRPAKTICERLRSAYDISARLNIIECELAMLLNKRIHTHENLRQLFGMLKHCDSSFHIDGFCKQNNISVRQLERFYNKYVGVSANTFSTINRFHNSMNQLLYSDYSKLSDIAFGNGYFDQTHFIKDFKRFAGNSPKNFINQNNSILQIGKLKQHP